MTKRHTQKVICYVVQHDHLLVITHLDVPMEVTGVQVPAGTIEPGETPEVAAVREVWEETGSRASVVRKLGEAEYDLSPARAEIAHRRFLLLTSEDRSLDERWEAGESDVPSGQDRIRWECWWMPIAQAHVLVAGMGALIGAIENSRGRV